ncbi:hypothetical protein IKN40_03955 [bacterium]|nr:hypothetical protein [bacterium]
MANKKCLVFETMNNINSSMHIVESANPKEIRLTGVFGVAGIKNNNNRIYDKQNYGMMVESLQKVIANEGCLGELEHPNSMNINLNNVSHKIESIEMNEDGTVTGTIVLIDTDKGRNAKAIIEAGVPLYISSRAAGSIDESGHVTLTSLKTYDLVGTPGFSQAKLNLSENQKFESLNESCCVIYEDDDLLGGDDEEDKDKKDDSSDSDNKEKSDKEDKKEDKKEKSDKEDKKEDNNKNNDNDKATMQDLKEAIDKLSEKIESLTADLHVAQESLQEKDKKIQELTEKLDNLEIPEVKYSKIQEWVEEEFAPEFKEQIMESVNNEIEDATESIAEGVQNWTINEFAPVLESYMTEEFAPEVQNWITEEFAPEVQNWIVEEYSPEVQNWITEEYSPEVQNWITEEFAPVVDSWINEECMAEHKQQIVEEVNNNVNAFMESRKQESLSNIDNLLEAIENKGKVDEALELLKEKQTDDKYKGVYVVENMPSEYMPKWSMLSEAKQQDIIRRSKMYNFTKPGVLESFWSTVNFEEEPINENLNNNVQDTYHLNIFKQMANLRKSY